MRDVAHAARVSRSAVSNYFNRPELVSINSARRISAAVERLGYIPNAAARNLRLGNSRTVGLVLLDAFLPFFSEFASGVEDAAIEFGWSVLSVNSNHQASRERKYFELFASWNVDGVIVFPTGDIEDSLNMLRSRGIGSVVVGATNPDPQFDSVWIDDRHGGTIAGRHLIETGCQRIAFVGDLRQDVVVARLEGLLDAARQFKEIQVKAVEVPSIDLAGGVLGGQRIVRNLAAEPFDGVFACTDVVAFGVLQAFLHSGLAVPDDLAVVGFDDVVQSAQQVVPLSTIRVPSHEIGRTSIELLSASLSSDGSAPAQHRVFEPTLVQRKSTRGRIVRQLPALRKAQSVTPTTI